MPLSEDLLFGLGSGLGFVYFQGTGIDPFYGGRGNVGPRDEGLEKSAGRRTGVVVESFVTSSARKAEASLQTLLESNEPVLLHLGMGVLPYLDLPPDYHFGGPVVVVAGFERDTKRVVVADRDLAEIADREREVWEDLRSLTIS